MYGPCPLFYRTGGGAENAEKENARKRLEQEWRIVVMHVRWDKTWTYVSYALCTVS